MVRLKDFKYFAKIVKEHTFQFQYGSIKRLDACYNIMALMYFNSNMVRLKVSNGLEQKEMELHFNSNMVRLKGLNSTYRTKGVIYFNSNMVRLKGYSITSRNAKLTAFQFQYGSIKS